MEWHQTSDACTMQRLPKSNYLEKNKTWYAARRKVLDILFFQEVRVPAMPISGSDGCSSEWGWPCDESTNGLNILCVCRCVCVCVWFSQNRNLQISRCTICLPLCMATCGHTRFFFEPKPYWGLAIGEVTNPLIWVKLYTLTLDNPIINHLQYHHKFIGCNKKKTIYMSFRVFTTSVCI